MLAVHPPSGVVDARIKEALQCSTGVLKRWSALGGDERDAEIRRWISCGKESLS